MIFLLFLHYPVDAQDDDKDTTRRQLENEARYKYGTTNIVVSMSACSVETNTRWLYLKCE